MQLPKNMLKAIPRDYFDGARGTLKLLWEDEWRGLGITQSLGWEHYEVHEPEPHILLFKYVYSGPAPCYRLALWRNTDRGISPDGRRAFKHRRSRDRYISTTSGIKSSVETKHLRY